MHPIVNVYKLGRLPYTKALNIQKLLFTKLKDRVTTAEEYQLRQDACTVAPPRARNEISLAHPAGLEKSGNSLLIVEHDPVYTIGIRSKQYDDSYVIKLKAKLLQNSIDADFVRTDRGGLITFHGPGQLVVYPILHLGDFPKAIPRKSIREYVKMLEKTVVQTLARSGLRGVHTVREYPGVWLANGERKIGFIGVSCKRYVTMHGIAINCTCDLSWFEHIVSCGIEDKAITTLQDEFFQRPNEHNIYIPTRTQVDKQAHQSQLDTFSCRSTSPSESSYTTSEFKLESLSHHVSVARISELFCSSFAQNFDCKLRDESFHFQST